MKKDSWTPSVGQRIHAAVVSAMFGYSGVDSTLKKMCGKPAGTGWDELGMLLMQDMVKGLESPLPENVAKIIPISGANGKDGSTD